MLEMHFCQSGLWACPEKPKVVKIRKYRSPACRCRATHKNLRDLQGDSCFSKFTKWFGKSVWKSTMAPLRQFWEMVQDLIGKWLIYFRNIGGVRLPIRSVNLPKQKPQMVKIRKYRSSAWPYTAIHKNLMDLQGASFSNKFPKWFGWGVRTFTMVPCR